MTSVIFDWSGVVKDAVHAQLWILNRMLERCGLPPIALGELQENWEQPYMLFYRKYLPDSFDVTEQATAYRELLFRDDCPRSSAYPGMVDLVRRLNKEGSFLAVVSSDLAESLGAEMKEYGLEGVFDEIVTDVPDKLDAVRAIVEKNGLSPDETFFVGDSNHEIDVAHKTGIRSVATTWGFTSETKLLAYQPDVIVHNALELEEAIGGHARKRPR